MARTFGESDPYSNDPREDVTEVTRPAADPDATLPGEPIAAGGDQTVMTNLADPDATVAASGSTAAASGDLAPGTVLGDFSVEGLLGRGGMGAVYRGQQRSLDRPVAIKVLPSQLGTNEDFVRRFELEARAVAKIQSPNVVQVYGAGSAGGHQYFAMEYVDGRDLAERLKDGLRPSFNQALDLVLQAALGLQAAGEQGIVHRDIKPSNMMVTDDFKLKLMDFGLVKLTSQGTSLTMAGTVMGTVSYFSPEQGRGEDCDQRTDIYALGIVFYELLTGVLPFVGENATSIIYQHIHSDPRPPKEINPEIPEAFQAVILKCLQKDAVNRYADAGTLISDLEALRDGRSPAAALHDPELLKTGATMISSTSFAKPKQKRSAVGPLLVVVLLLAAGGGGGWYWWTNFGPGSQSKAPPVQPRPVPRVTTPAAPKTPVVPETPTVPEPPAPDPDPGIDAGLAAGWAAEVRRRIGLGDWQGAAAAIGAPANGVDEATVAMVRGEWRNGQLAAARSALDAGDARRSATLLTPLAVAFPDDADVQAGVARQQQVLDAAAAIAAARAAAGQTDPAAGLTAMRAIETTGLPAPLVTSHAALQRALQGADQLLSTALDALARGDLQTARQSYLASFQKAETKAASDGLKIVAICEQFGTALEVGQVEAAGKHLAELRKLEPGTALITALENRLALAQAIAQVDETLAAGDLPGARVALATARKLGGAGERLAALQRRIDLAAALAAFRQALRADDLKASETSLAEIQRLDAGGKQFREAERALAASQLAEREREKAIAAAIAAVDARLAGAAPDWAVIDARTATLAKIHGERADLAALVTRVRQRQHHLAITASLAKLDALVRAAEGEALGGLVSDAAHRQALTRLIGQPDLTFAHQVDVVTHAADVVTTIVALKTSMRAVPETTLRYRYRWQQVDGRWVIDTVERMPEP